MTFKTELMDLSPISLRTLSERQAWIKGYETAIANIEQFDIQFAKDTLKIIKETHE